MTSLWSKHAWFRRTASALVIVLTGVYRCPAVNCLRLHAPGGSHPHPYLQWMQARHLDHYVEAGNFRLHYLHEGSGEAVILLPGGGAWIYDLRDVIAALAPHYAVYATDEPGDGYMALLLLRERPSECRARFDLPGFVLAATGLASVLYAL